MPLAHITLASGREVDLTTLVIDDTYDGLPGSSADVNEMILAELTDADEDEPPVHLVLPSEDYDPSSPLPAVTFAATFRSAPVEDTEHPDLAASWLTVVWFAASADEPVAGLVAPVVADLDWEGLAEDFDE